MYQESYNRRLELISGKIDADKELVEGFNTYAKGHSEHPDFEPL